MSCICGQWEEIHGFDSPGEYKSFVSWIESHLKEKKITEVNVEKPYDGSSLFRERWLFCAECGKIWRLVEYDFPFKGLFEKVEKNDSLA